MTGYATIVYLTVLFLVSGAFVHTTYGTNEPGNKFLPSFKMSFSQENHKRTVEPPKVSIISSDGGTIICQKTVTPDESCSGYGQNNMNDTILLTYFGYWDVFPNCGSDLCLTAYWNSSQWPSKIAIDGRYYYWVNATMDACIATECASPTAVWKEGKSRTVEIDNVPANVEVTIHAKYIYKSEIGD